MSSEIERMTLISGLAAEYWASGDYGTYAEAMQAAREKVHADMLRFARFGR